MIRGEGHTFERISPQTMVDGDQPPALLGSGNKSTGRPRGVAPLAGVAGLFVPGEGALALRAFDQTLGTNGGGLGHLGRRVSSLHNEKGQGRTYDNVFGDTQRFDLTRGKRGCGTLSAKVGRKRGDPGRPVRLKPFVDLLLRLAGARSLARRFFRESSVGRLGYFLDRRLARLGGFAFVDRGMRSRRLAFFGLATRFGGMTRASSGVAVRGTLRLVLGGGRFDGGWASFRARRSGTGGERWGPPSVRPFGNDGSRPDARLVLFRVTRLLFRGVRGRYGSTRAFFRAR